MLTDNERNVIRERHHGWEKASLSLLSAIFGVPSREIGRIVRSPAEPDTPPAPQLSQPHAAQFKNEDRPSHGSEL